MSITHDLPIGARIRKVRRERGWSLQECEVRSQGRLRAVTLASYERGQRSISLGKLQLIAEILEVTIEYLFGATNQMSPVPKQRHIYDLRALTLSPSCVQKQLLLSYLKVIIKKRGDWQGEVISLRTSDIGNLHLIFQSQFTDSACDYIDWIESQNFLMRLKSKT
ncbi:MAG: helix-turn-helix domain-containing protein [Candidatus Planktophila sp.]